MSAPSAAGRKSILIAAVLLIAAGAGAWWYFARDTAKAPDGPPPVLALSSSPYLNTGPDATYVGSEACIRCHESEHKSYARTGMSRSTSVVDVRHEPADGSVADAASGRSYRVERRGEQLWHREFLGTDGKPAIVLNEFPMTYAVGSGRFGKTYL